MKVRLSATLESKKEKLIAQPRSWASGSGESPTVRRRASTAPTTGSAGLWLNGRNSVDMLTNGGA